MGGERALTLDPRPQRIEDAQGEARLGLGDERGPDLVGEDGVLP